MSAEHDVAISGQSYNDQQQCELNDVGNITQNTSNAISDCEDNTTTAATAQSSVTNGATTTDTDLIRYSRRSLLALRKEQPSLQHPECALKPELQILSIWTCRLRNELQYLGLWKAPNNGNQYGNCTGGPGCCSNEGGCDGMTGDDMSYDLGSDGAGGSGYVGGLHQPPHLMGGPPSLLASKRTVRPRFMNPQRGGIHPAGSLGGSSGGIGSYIDHRSISSSHLMPAFVKRRSGNIPGKPVDGQAPPNLRSTSASSVGGYSGGGTNNDNDSSDGNEEHKAAADSHGLTGGSNLKRKELLKPISMYKGSPNARSNKDDPYADTQPGWMPSMSKLNPEYSPSGNKTSGPGGANNKRLVYERRIGSGRLMPREDSWGDMRPPGDSKRGDKEKLLPPQGKYNDNGVAGGGVDKMNLRNTSVRFGGDARNTERPHYERHALVDGGETDKYDSSTAASQRTMLFRSRGFLGGNSNVREHRDFKDFREARDLRAGTPRERRESRDYNRYSKDEPEWLSEGPTSQHDTIELRGFEEMDMAEVAEAATANGDKDRQIGSERKDSESSLFNSSSNLNLNTSTKEKANGSHETLNSDARDNELDAAQDNANSVELKESSPKENVSVNSSLNANVDLDNTMEKQAEQVVAASVAVAAAEDAAAVAAATVSVPTSDAVNITEQFFERFLNIDTLENSIIGGGHHQSLPFNESAGSSRFSRWFRNSSETNNNNNDVTNDISSPQPAEDKRHPPTISNTDLNENHNDVNSSLMAFFKSGNVPTPELPKGFPAMPAPLSVGELEARMRKMDAGVGERGSEMGGGFIMHGHPPPPTELQMRNAENGQQTNEMSGQDIGAFQKLLDQLGKPKVDIPMNLMIPPGGEQHMPIPTPIGMLPPGMIPHGLPHPTPPPPLNMLDHEDMLKLMHQQAMMRRHQTMLKMIPPQHHRMPPQQPSPQYQTQGGGMVNKNMQLGGHHPHLMSPIMGNPLQEQAPHQQQQQSQPPAPQQQQQPNPGDIMLGLQQTRPVHSPTPLAFTPTSVLRKMTAEKDNNAQQTPMPMASPQQQQQQQLQHQQLQLQQQLQQQQQQQHHNICSW
uniref:Nucleocytoplasmic shuttling protein for mRNA cap-binding EIF4E n=1 Tax=Musca domestica TaxID=7370 RepID=T1P9B3_MUSDO